MGARTENRQSFQQVLQLADVARPAIAGECGDRRRAETDRTVATQAQRLVERFYQQRQVLEPVTQRRQLYRKDVQAEVQVAAEPAAGDLRVQVAIGGGDDSHVRRAQLAAAHTLVGALLQDAQELRLQLRRHFRYLVEKQRATVGKLEAAAAQGDRARERSSLVAEQLAFHQLRRDRRAVDRHERARGAGRQAVQFPGDAFLAGARLAQDQHGGVEARDLGNEPAYPHGRRRPAGGMLRMPRLDLPGRAHAGPRAVLWRVVRPLQCCALGAHTVPLWWLSIHADRDDVRRRGAELIGAVPAAR